MHLKLFGGRAPSGLAAGLAGAQTLLLDWRVKTRRPQEEKVKEKGKWGNSGEEKGIRERMEIEKKNENTNTNNKAWCGGKFLPDGIVARPGIRTAVTELEFLVR